MRGEAPLLMRMTQPATSASPAVQVHLVGGAAGPLGGDRLHLSIEVGADSSLAMRSVAASLAQPGRVGAPPSSTTIRAEVRSGACLDWWPEPLVSVRGSDHRQVTDVAAADETAVVRWVDEIVLGRHDEPGGVLTTRQRVTVAGRPVLHHAARFDPLTDGIGRHGTARVLVTGILVGRPSLRSLSVIASDHRIARYPLDERCTAWIALAESVDVARAALVAAGLERCSIVGPEIAT